MNKAQLLLDLESKTLKTPKQVGDGRNTNLGDREYEYNVLAQVSHNVCQERIIPIRVLNEGTENEVAYYVDQPPVNREAVIAAELAKLQAAGTVIVNDLSYLDIKFADVDINDQRVFVTILNGASVIIPGK